jgi:hypothetical protein
MQNASLHQLLYHSLRKKNNINREIIQNETILNGHLSQQYIRKISMANKMLNFLVLLHFLLLHCYVAPFSSSSRPTGKQRSTPSTSSGAANSAAAAQSSAWSWLTIY